jgi:hypothetical protein
MTFDEEQGRRQVRELVESSPAPAHNVDVRRAIAAGRRALRRRRWGVAMSAAAAVLLVSAGVVTATRGLTDASVEHRPGASPSPTPSPTPSQAPIPELDCTQSSGTGFGTGWSQPLVVDPTGRYIAGRHEDRPDTTKLTLWRDGSPSTINFYPAGFRTGITPIAITSSGVMAGTGGNARERSWVYRNGNVQVLESPTDYPYTAVVGMNERGDVVGRAWFETPAPATPTLRFVAVIWAVDAQYRPQVLPSEREATAFGITDDGTVVGTVNDLSRGTATLYAWSPDGVGRALSMPEGWEQPWKPQLRGDWVVAAPRLFKPRPELMSLARWNVRTNELRTFNDMDLTRLHGGTDWLFELSPAGWLLVVPPALAPVIVKPDGTAGRLPESAREQSHHSIGAVRLSDDGLTVTVYMLRKENASPTSAIWRCRPW